MKLGSTALLLRMVESGTDLKDLRLKNPLQSAHLVSKDLSLQKPLEMADSSTMRAVEIQYELARRAKELAKKIELPIEEEVFINEWLDTCDRLQHRPETLIGEIDWITRLYAVYRNHDQKKTPVPILAKLDLAFDQLSIKRDGIGQKLREKTNLYDKSAIEEAITTPPNTRAKLRGAVVRAIGTGALGANRVQRLDWHQLTVDDKYIELPNPAAPTHSGLEKILNSCTPAQAE